ncbi:MULTISPECIES: carboxymuconolactone decarboxylase family protein [Roseomonadaceae]|uniref:Carboxymuconolactone decarboxylase family protein n=1 Tax=Falsiroseomonas oleicola TaxID=2801474 RepID=A0ABS6HAE8_9PROT|nr:carboxymuconolactone decarboxylase family protein [Roseomonas oleicola]MBU8544466.1 carboxymuconolactone decarboxylase family protein [Roseomonas oleicola]
MAEDFAPEALPEVLAVFEEIKAARGVADVNNFWKSLAVDPVLLRRTWESLSAVMAPGALDPLVKEMLYLAASMTSGCAYCTASHTAAARAKGMTPAQYGELLAVVGMAAETNRLAEALRVPIDPQFQ